MKSGSKLFRTLRAFPNSLSSPLDQKHRTQGKLRSVVDHCAKARFIIRVSQLAPLDSFLQAQPTLHPGAKVIFQNHREDYAVALVKHLYCSFLLSRSTGGTREAFLLSSLLALLTLWSALCHRGFLWTHLLFLPLCFSRGVFLCLEALLSLPTR